MGYYGGSSGGGGPAGINTQVQFNDDGAVGADAGLAYDKNVKALQVDACVIASPVDGNESIVVGQNLVTNQGNNVLLGRNMSLNASNCIVITNGGAAPAQQDSVCIGRPLIAGGQKSTHVGRLGGCSGQRGASLGYDARCTHSSAVAIGDSARTSKSNRATFGSDSKPMEVEATSHARAKGALITAMNNEPAETALANGEVGLWFDAVSGDLKLIARLSDGTVIRGDVKTQVGP